VWHYIMSSAETYLQLCCHLMMCCGSPVGTYHINVTESAHFLLINCIEIMKMIIYMIILNWFRSVRWKRAHADLTGVLLFSSLWNVGKKMLNHLMGMKIIRPPKVCCKHTQCLARIPGPYLQGRYSPLKLNYEMETKSEKQLITLTVC
jgi:hypothetical protein